MAETGQKWVCRMVEGKFTMIDVNEFVAPPEAGYYVIDDTIPQTWHPVDGSYCESKSRMRAIGKAHGLIELGNERVKAQKYRPSEADRQESRERLSQAYENATRNRR